MTRPRRPWPKAANEARHDAIMEAGAIRVKVRAMREKIVELEEAINSRDLRIALAIAPHLDGLLQVVDKSAEIIVLKLENAKAEEE